jgi:glycosyltransferase involved in cell wall biosynthesis
LTCVQYPVFGASVDTRAKYFTAIHNAVRRVLPTRIVPLRFTKNHWILRQELRLLERRDTVTHIPSNVLSFLLRKGGRCPTVITLHHPEPGIFERLPLADRVIAVSKWSKTQLESVLRLEHEPVVVHNAVPPAYRPPATGRSFERANGTSAPLAVLFVGTERPRKNIDGMFRIFARVLKDEPRAKLLKVSGRSDNRPRLDALAKNLGIRDHIIDLDFVPEERMPTLYQSATVTAVPSLLEGFSMPCLEAMACGCPLVASNVTAIPEVVGDGGVLLDPADEGSWAEAILRLHSDTRHAARLSAKALERAREFSPEQSARQWVQVYEEVTKSWTS